MVHNPDDNVTWQNIVPSSVHSSIIYNNWKVKTTPMSTSWWMETHNAVHAYSEILLRNKKERRTGICYNMEKLWKHHGKLKKKRHKRSNIIWFHLYEVSRVVEFIKTESRIVVANDWRAGGMTIYSLMDMEFQFGKMKLPKDGKWCWWGWVVLIVAHNVNILNELNYTLKYG